MNKLKLFTGLMVLVLGLSGLTVFANPTNPKTRSAKSGVAKAHPKTVKITVSKSGFSPSSIEAEAGHKVNLVFNRADKDNCGSVVVFPKLKIRKNLPVGKDVIVSFTPTTSGSISFSCGMGMMKGKIVVSE